VVSSVLLSLEIRQSQSREWEVPSWTHTAQSHQEGQGDDTGEEERRIAQRSGGLCRELGRDNMTLKITRFGHTGRRNFAIGLLTERQSCERRRGREEEGVEEAHVK
jgi:hypothetical protein